METPAPTLSMDLKKSRLATAVASTPSATKAEIASVLKLTSEKAGAAKTQKPDITMRVVMRSAEVGFEFVSPFLIKIANIAVNAADEIAIN
jgi:hypothetical protein